MEYSNSKQSSLLFWWCIILLVQIASTKFEVLSQEPWKTSHIYMDLVSYITFLYGIGRALFTNGGDISAFMTEFTDKSQTTEEKANKQSRGKCFHHKRMKSVNSEINFIQRKSSYSEEKMVKLTYLDKMLHCRSQLPFPQLKIAVFMNGGDKHEPPLDILKQIADGKAPGPRVTMRYELYRLLSFQNYPHHDKPFLIQLAAAGFYYSRESDVVVCYCCGLAKYSWEVKDVPYRIHQRNNPNCKFLNRNSEVNVPITYNGTTANLDKLDKLLTRLKEENMPSQASAHAEGGKDLHEALNNPKHRQYVSKALRLSSYAGWPDNLIQTPEIMAEAGFYYTGVGDFVRCYHCNIGLKDWEAEDNVWIEHARWSKHCAFVKQTKGQEFIKCVHKAYQNTQGVEDQQIFEASNPDDREEVRNGSSEQTLVDKIMLTDPAQSVLEMGYTPKIIKKAIAFILKRDGRSGLSSQTIMEKVLEFKEAEDAKTLALTLANMDLGSQDNSSGGPDSGSSRKSSQKSSVSKPSKDTRSESMKDENEKLKEQTLCRVCTTNSVCIVLLPCGHVCACDECGSALRTCPMCQKDVKGTVKAYMS